MKNVRHILIFPLILMMTAGLTGQNQVPKGDWTGSEEMTNPLPNIWLLQERKALKCSNSATSCGCIPRPQTGPYKYQGICFGSL